MSYEPPGIAYDEEIRARYWLMRAFIALLTKLGFKVPE